MLFTQKVEAQFQSLFLLPQLLLEKWLLPGDGTGCVELSHQHQAEQTPQQHYEGLLTARNPPPSAAKSTRSANSAEQMLFSDLC